MSAYFVTATGTDVGKTFVAAGLVRHWRASGMAAQAFKPVMTGYDPAEADGSDAGLLLKAMGEPVEPENIERVSPWRYAAPLSPHVATRRENRTLPFDELVTFSRRTIAAHTGPVLIEGVGGVMVPLDDRYTVMDWMKALGLPLVVVTGTYLGTISHTLTALDVLKRNGLTVKVLVVNETAGSPVSLGDTMLALKHFTAPTPLVGLPRHPERAAFRAIADLL